MSDTPVDMLKVKEMLDKEWEIELYANDLGSYTAKAWNPDSKIMEDAIDKFEKAYPDEDIDDHMDHQDLITDDFTPEQALTRMAYKVEGVII